MTNVESTNVAQPPLVRGIELKNIDHLQQEATPIYCVSCQKVGLSTVSLEQVTCWQRFVTSVKICKNWRGRHDINHYCSHCGCYIGRYVELSSRDRCTSKRAHQQAAKGKLSPKKQHKSCAERIQETRDQGKERKSKEQKVVVQEVEKFTKLPSDVDESKGK